MGNVVSNPQVSLSLVSADTNVSNTPQKVLLVGIKASDGTATSATLVENIANDGSETTLFGVASQLTRMVREFKKIAPMVQVDAIPVAENAGGTAPQFTITVTGTATEAGTVDVIAGSYRNSRYSVAVASGATASTVGTAIAAAINADAKCLFTAGSVSGVVTLTHVHKGTFGNSAPVGATLNGRVSGIIGGLTVAIANTVAGATNPTALSASTIFDVVGNNRYQGVVWPDDATSNVPSSWLDGRFNTNNRIVDGVVFVSKFTTYNTALSSVASANSKSLVLIIDKIVNPSGYIGPAGREPTSIVSTCLAAVRAVRLTSGAAVSQYITTSASSDQFGGPALASLPYFNTTIPILSLPIAGQGFTDTEISTLEAQGATIIGQNTTNTQVLVGTVRMTYKTDPAGNTDPSWKYLNYVDTMSNVREYFFNNYRKRFAQSRLTEGTVQRGRDMVNRALFEAYTDQLYGDLSGPDFVLVQSGEDALKFFKKNRIVTLDLETGTINIAMLVPIVTQVRTIIGTIKIAFSTEG